MEQKKDEPSTPRVHERGRSRDAQGNRVSASGGTSNCVSPPCSTKTLSPTPVPWPAYGAVPATSMPQVSVSSSTAESAASSRSASVASTPSAVQVFDAMEREQEAIVNKLQREISTLREERSRSRSRSSSHSSIALRPQESIRRSRLSTGEQEGSAGLYKENEQLRRKIAELSLKLAEKDQEIETLRSKTVSQV